MLAVLKACRRFNPLILKSEELKVEALENELVCLPFLDLPAMVRDYDAVRAAAKTAQGVGFWHTCPIKSWATGAMRALTLCPTSASCERIFSIMNALFDDRRKSSLEDFVETSVMIRANNFWRQKGDLELD
jgi:hypothetical protein